MEKNSMHPVKVGKGIRMSYSKRDEVLEMPNLIEVQKNSYKWFIEKTDGGYLLKREGKYVTTTEEPTWHYQYLSDAESSSDAIVWTLLTEE